MIYLDNAATTGQKPPEVTGAVLKALREYSANPGRSGHKRSELAAQAVYTAREKAAALFGAQGPEQVAFTAGCTHSLNCVLKGVLHEGDHVIVSSLEHNAVMRPLYKSGISYDAAAVSLIDDDETVENFRRLIRPNTRMICCTGASNVLGRRLPIRRLGGLCRDKGLLFAVDAAQTAGVVPIDMGADHIDYLCIAPHKGLYAPMGVGILIAGQPLENTVLEGGTGTDSVSFRQPDSLPEQIESGTVNLPGIIGTAAGMDFISRKGIGRIYEHEMRLIGCLYEGLESNPRVILYTPDPRLYSYAPVLSFNLRDIPSGQVAGFLDRNGVAVRAGLHCAPTAHRQIGTIETGTVRVCPSVFNSMNDIMVLLHLLSSKSLKN